MKHLRLIISFFIIILISIHFIYSFNRYKKEYLSTLEHKFKESKQDINKTISLATGFLNMIQSHCDNYQPDIRNLKNTPFVFIENSTVFSGYTLNGNAMNNNPNIFGNLTGLGDIQSFLEDTLLDFSRAFSLTPLFIIATEYIPNAQWLYYQSNNDFIYIYPFIPDAEYHYIAEIREHQNFTKGLPVINPGRDFYWSSVYVDRADKTLMVTLAIPIYYQDKFKGIMALDLTLNTLGDYLKEKKEKDTHFFIADPKGDIIADAQIKFDTLSSTPQLDSLGYFNGALLADIYELESDQFVLSNGVYILKSKIQQTPWSLYFTERRSSINYKIFVKLIPQNIIALLSIVMIFLIFRITQTQKIIRENEKKFRTVFNELKQMMFVLSPDAIINESNSVSSAITGLKENIVRNVVFYKLPIWAKTSGLPQLFKSSFEKCLKGEFIHVETELLNHHDQYKTFDFTFFPIHDSSGKIFLIIVSGYDISDLKEIQKKLHDTIEELQQTQDQLIISEKQAAFGQMAASLAHELNNPMAALKASFTNYKDAVTTSVSHMRNTEESLSPEEMRFCTGLVEHYLKNPAELSSREERELKKSLMSRLSLEIPEDAEQIAKYLVILKIHNIEVIKPYYLSKNLNLILKMAVAFTSMEKNDNTIMYAIKRTLNIVSSFKEYATQDVSVEQQEMMPEQVVNNVINLLSPMIRPEMELVQDIIYTGAIKIGKDDIYQIFTHLIKNAIQASPANGRIYMTLDSKEGHLIFNIKDEGHGIPAEIADKIYEPFFTTKGLGEGAGLGLYIIKNLIKNNKGNIEYSTIAGKGTSFEVRLPLE